MADRITWQNVAAPDMRTAILGQVAAGDQLAKGFSSLGSTFKGVNAQNITDESNAAIMEAMKIQDPAAWDKMMATSGIAGLGIGAGRANADLLNFAAGYGNELTADRETERAYNASVYAAGQGRIQDQRAEALYQKGLADEAMKQEALQTVAGRSSKAMTADQVKQDTWNYTQDQGFDPAKTAAYMAAADGVNPMQFQASAGALAQAAALPEVLGITETIASAENAFRLKNSTDIGLAYYRDAAASTINTDNPGVSLAESISSKIDPSKPKDEGDNALYATTAGKAQDTYNELTKAYPGVPAMVVAKILQNSVESNGYIWSDDQLKLDKEAAVKILDEMNTPEKLALLEQRRTGIDREAALYTGQKQALDAASQKYAWALSQQEPDIAAQALEEMRALQQSMEGASAGLPPDSSAPASDVPNGAAGASTVDANGNPVTTIPLDPRQFGPPVGNSIRTYPGEQSYNATFGDALAKAAGVNKGLAPEIMNSVAVASDLGNTADSYGERLDRFGGGLFASTVEGIDALSRRAAVAAGGLFPETGNLAIKEIDAASAARAPSRNALRTEGFFADETQAAPKGPAVPVSPELSDAVNEYADMAAMAEIDLSQNTRARKALEVLATGRDPNGNPLSDAQKEVATQRLVEAMESSGTKFVSRKQKDALINKLLSAAKVSRK